MSRRLVVEADGGSRGNPGPAAFGALVRDADTGAVLAEVGQTLGVTTNNVAEYRGLLAGLRAARGIDPDARVEARLDSKLVVEQMSGRWKIKNDDLRAIALEARDVLPSGAVTYTWVPRAQNTAADRLVNRALDGAPIDRVLDQADDVVPSAVAATAPTETADGATRLILVRHGQTAMTLARQLSGGGVPGPDLDDVGRLQADAVGRALAGCGATAVVASPMHRTRQTAEAVAGRLGVPVQVDAAWRELEFGLWEGLTFAEVARDPLSGRGWGSDVAVHPPGGETVAQLDERIRAARDAVVSEHAGSTVVVVTHSMPVRILASRATGAGLEGVFRVRPLPASVTELEIGRGGDVTLTTFGAAPWALIGDG